MRLTLCDAITYATLYNKKELIAKTETAMQKMSKNKALIRSFFKRSNIT